MAIVLNPISPVAFSIFGIDVRWYALAYVVAFVLGYFLVRRFTRHGDSNVTLSSKQLDDLLTAIVLGVILGGRLGYVLFYNLGFFMAHPSEIFAIWHGGMSFHGGLVGVIVATFLFARRNKINPWAILDILSVVAPIGLFFGRIANFINMELMGHETTRPWGVIFNGVSTHARHPSPLYEAATEGIALFIIMYCLYRWTPLRRRPGALAGIMGMGYALARLFCEQFRVPDAQIGFLLGTDWLTMGMVLSMVMFFVGATIFAIAFRKK